MGLENFIQQLMLITLQSESNIGWYSIPHPSLECINVRVQTTGDPAREVLKDACQELMLMNRHVRSVFDKAVSEFKEEQARLKAEEERKKAEEEELKKQRDLLESMDIESN
ncbi:hypothetical protein F2Q68_00044894 [Brassica cretica]|uniref:DNA-directed RNA polymerase RBP11-like dimerisation domain-containing protein n=2 Tax=Brassica TaxID=3705 RepID=A0A8S9LJL9_BRACR|nr:hypothetical protein F2Q68_00044894 [Brassica cretica]